MSKFLLCSLLFFSTYSYAKNSGSAFNRMPASSADSILDVKKHVDSLLDETMKLDGNNPSECSISKNGKFTCYRTEAYSLCASGVREASNVEVRGSVEGAGKDKYIQVSEIVYRLACFGKN
ncbi:MAG: hypothetical protein ACK5P7_06565 [Bdellovibrio sp.]|jgi:hypothetical protein